jgi:hypothetical protein
VTAVVAAVVARHVMARARPAAWAWRPELVAEQR